MVVNNAMSNHEHDKRRSNHRVIRMIIVDDEPIICEGLKKTIDWSQLGVEVAGVAYDGEQALQIVQSEPIDIVLTDIRMDGIDGLELAEQLRAMYPEISLVMISGYEDFEYARRAMRIGVSDYLLKPVNIDELKAVVSNVIARIRERDDHGSREEDVLWLMNAIHSKAEFAEAVLLRRCIGAGGSFRVIASQLADYEQRYGDMPAEEIRDVQAEWKDMLEASLHAAGLSTIFAFAHPNLLYAFVHDPHNSMNERQWEKMLSQAAANWQHEGEVAVALSASFTESEKTSEACERVKQMLFYSILQPEAILTEQLCKELENERRAFRGYSPPGDWASRLSSLLYRQEWAEAEAMMRELFAEMRKQRLLLPEMLSIYEEQMALLRQRLRHNAMQMNQTNERKLSVDLHQYNSYDAFEQLLLEELHALLDAVGNQSVNKSYWIVEKAMKYIAEHYSEDMKASEVAEWLNITPNHFSYIFKQNTGKNFKEYMNDVRIGHAQRLLATTNDKVFEIADRVGYKEYKYFVSVFKSVTGMTPKEYRAIKASM